MKNTKYAKATGGTPIISWVPNQIGAVLSYMKDLTIAIESEDENFLKIKCGLEDKINLLRNQIDELREKNYDVLKLDDMFGNLDDRKVKF